MKKRNKLIFIMILLLLLIFVKEIYDKPPCYSHSKSIEIDNINIDMNVNYTKELLEGLFQPREYKFMIDYDIKIGKQNITDETSIKSEESDAMILDFLFYKDYENEDFISYTIVCSFQENAQITYKNIENIIYLKREDEYLSYYSWEIMLSKILIKHNYIKYDENYMLKISDDRITVEDAIESGMVYLINNS